jgi:hypothetical protein
VGITFDASSAIDHGLLLNDIDATNTGRFSQKFRRNGTVVGSVQTSLTATTYVTSSDYRLKDITGPLTGSRAFIDALAPKQGTWKTNGAPFAGFLAHELQAVSPSSVAGEKDAVDDSGDYAVPVHCEKGGLLHVELEIRQDLIESASRIASSFSFIAVFDADAADAGAAVFFIQYDTVLQIGRAHV